MGKKADLITLYWIASFICSPGAVAQESVSENGNLMGTLRGQSVFEIAGSDNLSGRIQVISRQIGDINVNFTKTARASTKAEANRFLNLIDFKLEIIPDRAILRILSPSQAPWEGTNHSVRVDLQIEVPEKMTIEGHSRYLAIDIGGPFQGVVLKNSYSALGIEKIYGPVDIVTSYGDVYLSAIKGRMRAETQNGNIDVSNVIIPSGFGVFQSTGGAIRLRDIEGAIEANTSYAEINVDEINASEGSIVLRTSYAPIKARNVVGELICETSYNPVSIANATINHGYSKIETSYAPIDAEFTEVSNCELFVANNYSDVNLSIPRGVSAMLVASVDRGGRIRTKDLNLQPTALELTRLEGILGEGQARIEVQVSGIGSTSISGR